MLLKLMEEEEREPKRSHDERKKDFPQLHVTETDGRRRREREHQRSHDETFFFADFFYSQYLLKQNKFGPPKKVNP